MTEKTQIWNRNGINITFLNRPFRFTDLTTESKNQSDGENRLVRQQQAMLNLLKTGECNIPDQEMQMAIIQRLISIIKNDEQLSALDDKSKNTVIQTALRQLPLESQMSLTFASTTNQPKQPAKKFTAKTNRPAFAGAAINAPKARPQKANDNKTQPQKRTFSLLNDENAFNDTRIFFGQEEILLDDIDEHTVLTTILDAASRDNSVSNDVIKVRLGGGVDLSRLYMALKSSMDVSIVGSSRALKYDSKTQRHSTTTKVAHINSEQDLFTQAEQNAPIALPPSETPGAFGS